MSAKNSIRYSDEFKQQIVDLYGSGKTMIDLSGEYGVSTVTIYKWIKDLSPMEVSSEETMPAKEYQAMKKRIAQLEKENEILKKATAIFSRKQ
ncbi:transposase [Garciella nitratireducens]|uniref:transposase n=1 Tax=Garciella nitratireducens TaxID=218205 RepID=UPI001BD265DB|nr:transposase [Garciella nitratireducens]